MHACLRTALLMAALAGLMAPVRALAQPAGDGARLFAQRCSGCHAAAGFRTAPDLAGVAGAPVAGRPNFTYSQALAAHGGTWTDEALDTFLKAPLAFAPGGRMPVATPDADERRALIAYLKTLK